jgi:hypothetical protein
VIVTVDTHMGNRVFDANGDEIPLVVWAETSSGVVVRFVRDSRGGVRLNADRTEALRVVDKYRSPLRLEPVA